MKLHNNSALTVQQRKLVRELYASGAYTQIALANQFGCTRKTISKWVGRNDPSDLSSRPKVPSRSISAEFEQAVSAYRADPLTSHHGVVRIALALRDTYECSNPSNVYLTLKRLQLSRKKILKERSPQGIPVGKHRTQMDIQQLPAVEGGHGFEYKISIIHLSTRMKYSEIHDNYDTKTLAKVYEKALERLPPFS